jgi:hypothetical protein
MRPSINWHDIKMAAGHGMTSKRAGDHALGKSGECRKRRGDHSLSGAGKALTARLAGEVPAL